MISWLVSSSRGSISNLDKPLASAGGFPNWLRIVLLRFLGGENVSGSTDLWVRFPGLSLDREEFL